MKVEAIKFEAVEGYKNPRINLMSSNVSGLSSGFSIKDGLMTAINLVSISSGDSFKILNESTIGVKVSFLFLLHSSMGKNVVIT